MRTKKPKPHKGNIALFIETKFTEDTKQACQIDAAICSLSLIISRPILTKLLNNQKPLSEKVITTAITEMFLEKMKNTNFQILDSELISSDNKV